MREALFSILAARGVFDEPCRVLDLWAGTGALALEALSRGARHAILVEQDRAALATIAANVQALGVRDRATVLGCAVAKAAPRLLGAEPFDLVLADPPYAQIPTGECARAVSPLVPSFSRYATVVVEHAAGDAPPPIPGLAMASTRRYGDTAVTLYDVAGTPAATDETDATEETEETPPEPT